ncbi:CBS domain-containing protein [Aliiroseovarius sp. S1339]|uniref:CBS domain-containing protein n=1 Tax=Aliiroseovarius sp. S1339 TaxID=2936990 RepID=UPI0020BDCB7E|nr:CBS domain-containing protein [Aliiroseovarius sp. S1339]MCK8462790.1 CBS domain-containing protein [Aliiroseovarius sp. S1339]
MSQPEETRVRDAIQQDPHVINGLASVAEALQVFQSSGHDTLVIEKRSPDDEFGVLTISMIARQVFARNRTPSRVSVYEVMEKPAINISGNMQARYAIRLLARLNLNVALVVEDDTLIGTVGLRELTLAEAATELTDTTD